MHENNNNINNNDIKRITLYYKDQMHKKDKLDEQEKTNIIYRYVKPIELQKQIKLIIHYTKFKTQTSQLKIPETFLNKMWYIKIMWCINLQVHFKRVIRKIT